jgi:diadenosine tetraphosphate (Ap4A) HIT family hydrolase
MTAGAAAAQAFELDPRLQADSVALAEGPLSQLRLVDDTRFAWLVLVPRVPGAVEWVDLDGGAQRLLLAEVNRAAALLRATGPCAKLNVGALGNVVRQLHVHVVARNEGDAAWPGPVWGAGAMQRHAADALAARVARLRDALQAIDAATPSS